MNVKLSDFCLQKCIKYCHLLHECFSVLITFWVIVFGKPQIVTLHVRECHRFRSAEYFTLIWSKKYFTSCHLRSECLL